jgi:hypothetical protein
VYSKADYLNYLDLLAVKERDSIFGLHQLLEQVSEEPVAGQLRTLLRNKQKAYQDIIRLFSSFFGLPAEQRRYKREPALGDVKLRNLESGEMTTCRCLDISLGGLCVQVQSQLQPGLLLALEVRFFESARPILRRAAVRWCNRTREGSYRAGLQFEATQTLPAGETICEDV